jgi:hypothetical protein
MKAMAIRMKAREIQSSILGYEPLKLIAKIKVEAVPAIRDVSRFTSPAKVAVLPLNINIKTEKKATAPNAVPEITAQNQ